MDSSPCAYQLILWTHFIPHRNNTIQHLLNLYGKVEVSNQKLRAVDAFNKGMRLRDIACELCVQLPTAEVYLIDSLVAGKDLDHERLGKYLHITKEHFLLLRDELLVKPRLSIVKQSYPSFTYNQIRFVLACLIRDMEVWLSCALRKKKTLDFSRTLKTLASDFIQTIVIVYPYNKYCYFSDETLFLFVYFWREMWLIVNVLPFGRETLVNGTLWEKFI